MAIQSFFSALVSSAQAAPLPYILGTVVVLLTLLWYWARDELPYAGFPIVGKEKGEWLNTKAKMRYVMNANAILKQGLTDRQGPFQVFASHGPVIILPPSMIDEIRDDDRLSFLKSSQTLFLSAITAEMAKDANSVIKQLLPSDSKDWTPICFATLAPVMAARLSARAFVGEPLCHNREWLDISVMYTVNAMQAVQRVRHWPPFLRPIVQYLLPEFKVIRGQIKAARKIIEPEIAERKKKIREANKSGKAVPRSSDALEWMDVQAGEKPIDKVLMQLLMGLVSIHTTSGTTLGLMYDIVSHPEYIESLRKEAVEVLQEEGGWTKTALYKMKLMDSCLKESQRRHPMSASAMIGVPTWPMNASGSSFYSDPDKFDGHRFLHLREDNDMKWQFITTSTEHFGFGHGKQACPGRFFASNEIKVIVAHLLLMFDWRFAKGDEPKSLSLMDSEFVPDITQKIWVKPRVPEIDIASF
ncbi:hypothetical protein SLS57_003421 [Botryosphaeria dothidea]